MVMTHRIRANLPHRLAPAKSIPEMDSPLLLIERIPQCSPLHGACGGAQREATVGARSFQRRRRSRCSRPCCSSRREPKDPEAFRRDYDQIRSSLGAARGLPTIGRVLNFVSSTFGGANPSRLAQSESLGERALGFAWDVFSRFSPERVEDTTSRHDPSLLARAASRATDAERAVAQQAWRTWPTDDAETGALLSLGITVLRRDEGLSADIAAVCSVVAALCQTLQCTVTAASLALHREPMLQMCASSALMTRVLVFRRCVPTADLTRMVLNYPTTLVLDDIQLEYFVASVGKLRGALPLCEWVDVCVQEDPQLMLCDFDPGLRDLADLWSAREMATMDAEEAALALRALSGLPRRGVVPGWRTRPRESTTDSTPDV